jgi:hypothetical protein
MPNDLIKIQEEAIKAHEQFHADNKALDYAHKTGRLQEWITNKVNESMGAKTDDSGNET